jgi:hypothetical protein
MPRSQVPETADTGWEEDAVILERDDISDFNEANILPQPPEVLAKIRAWLQPTSYDDEGCEYKKHLSCHVAGTGGWILASSAYMKWRSTHKCGMLWIRGEINIASVR